MPNFVVHDAAGNILRAGYCSRESDVALQAIDPGESVIEFIGDTEIDADPATKMVVDGQLVDKE